MPDFSHGRRARIFMNGADLSRYMTDVSLSGGYDQTETTTFGQGSQSFVTGIRNGGEGSISSNVEVAGQKVMRRILKRAGGRDDNLLSIFASNEFGALGYGVRCGLSEQEFSSAPGDLSTFNIGVQGNRGVDDLICLHESKAEAATGNGSTYDDETATTAGATGHLHVQAAAGGTCDVVIQHSPDGTTWATLLTFAQVAVADTVKHQRVSTAPTASVDKNVRVQHTLGVGASCTYTCGFYRGKPDEDVS